MSSLRILVLSHTRPSRAWRMSERIFGEVPGCEVCGVVQLGWRHLSSLQRLIAAGDVDEPIRLGSAKPKLSLRLQKLASGLLHAALWIVHGCPRRVTLNGKFTVEDLAAHCRELNRPFLSLDSVGDDQDDQIVAFAHRQRADLIIVLGDYSPPPGLLDQPRHGLLRASAVDAPASPRSQLQQRIEIKIEHFAKGTRTPKTLGSLTLPSQAYDSPLGVTLKADLLADDLAVEAAKSLRQGSQAKAAADVKAWIERTVFPYLDQFDQPCRSASRMQPIRFDQRYRSIERLLVQSLLLPWVMVRNWYRRFSGRYPVLILAHHLVSDRPHRMATPTEQFWRLVRFLQRHYRIVSLSEADQILASGRATVPSVVLTFDDGYCDNFVALRAVAEETGAPITLFVATRPVELHEEFDHDRAAGETRFCALTWDQIRHWSRRGAEFGSHTRTHYDCGSTDISRLEREIVGSKADLESRLGQPVRFFAFPFGKPKNISPEALELAASTYTHFDSSLGGENLPRRGRRVQHLLRKNFYPDTWELELELQSVFDLTQKCKRILRQLVGSSRTWPQLAKP